MFYVNMHTQTHLCLHMRTLPQSLLFHREYRILNSYAGNSPCGRTDTVEIAVQTQTVLVLVLIS